MEIHNFDTREAILALCLILAGAEPLDPSQPCFNLFDEEILSGLGYKGKPLWQSAQEAWKDKDKGDVGYVLKMTERTPDLIRAYRDQCKQIEELDGTTTSLIVKILGQHELGAMLQDEMLLRISCVILKTRGEFMNLWKKMIPILRVPVDGKVQTFDSTVLSNGKVVEAKGVQRPGFRVISLNASGETRKHLGL